MAVNDVAYPLRSEGRRQTTQGNVRLRHHESNEIILVPAPSSDVNDPLNWPRWYKNIIAVIVCAAMLMCNFLAAGPTVAIVQTTLEFFPASPPAVDPVGFGNNIAKVSYFFTVTALLQGLGNFLWVPLAAKYGRRPTYIISYTIYLASAIWAIFDKSFTGFLTARIIMGFGAGAAETMAPLTIADVFFLHERGAVMVLYTSFLSVGVAFGILISGLITINHNWRVIYEVASAFIGFILLMAFFVFPETAFVRNERHDQRLTAYQLQQSGSKEEELDNLQHAPTTHTAPKRKSYPQMLKLLSGTGKYTNEPLHKIFVRPLGLICLPPVLWSSTDSSY